MEILGPLVIMFVFVPILAILGANKEAKEQKKRNAAYKSQYGQSMKLMTVHTTGKEKEITRSADGEVYGSVSFKAVEMKDSAGKGYVAMYDYPSEKIVDRVVLSTDVQKIFATDPLYPKYAVNGTILCDNGKGYTDRELYTWSKLGSGIQESYASILFEQQRISYKKCQEIVTLLDRIQKGIYPDETRKTEAKGKKTLAIILIIILLLGIVDIFLFMYLS